MLSDAPFARVGRGRTSIFRGRSRDGLSLHAAPARSPSPHAAQDRGAGRKAAAAFNCFAALASVVSSPASDVFWHKEGFKLGVVLIIQYSVLMIRKSYITGEREEEPEAPSFLRRAAGALRSLDRPRQGPSSAGPGGWVDLCWVVPNGEPWKAWRGQGRGGLSSLCVFT